MDGLFNFINLSPLGSGLFTAPIHTAQNLPPPGSDFFITEDEANYFLTEDGLDDFITE